MLRVDLPNDVRRYPDAKLLWDHTNIVFSIANDMLIFKKEIEIEQPRLDNLVIILCLQHGSLQAAMDGAFERFRESKDMLGLFAKRLLSKYPVRSIRSWDKMYRNPRIAAR